MLLVDMWRRDVTFRNVYHRRPRQLCITINSDNKFCDHSITQKYINAPTPQLVEPSNKQIIFEIVFVNCYASTNKQANTE